MPGDEVYVQGVSDCHHDIKSVLLVRHHSSDDFPYRMGFDVLAVPTDGTRDAEGRPAEPRMVFADYDDVFQFLAMAASSTPSAASPTTRSTTTTPAPRHRRQRQLLHGRRLLNDGLRRRDSEVVPAFVASASTAASTTRTGVVRASTAATSWTASSRTAAMDRGSSRPSRAPTPTPTSPAWSTPPAPGRHRRHLGCC